MPATDTPGSTRFLQRTRMIWMAGLALLFGASSLLVPVETDPEFVDPTTAILRWLPPTFVLVLLAALAYHACRPIRDDAPTDNRMALGFTAAAMAPIVGLLVAFLMLQAPDPAQGDGAGLSAELGATVAYVRFLSFLPSLAYVVTAARFVQLRRGSSMDKMLWWVAALPLTILALASISWGSPDVSVDALMLLSTAPAIAVLLRGVARNRLARTHPLASPPPFPRIE